jgi:hypothetical protein
MIFRWNYKCFLCDHPIDLDPIPETHYEWLAYYHYRFVYNPVPLFMNRMYYKTISGKMRRVCASCFKTYRPVPFRVLRDREIGLCRVRPTRQSMSLTKEALMEWLGGMEEFFYHSNRNHS